MSQHSMTVESLWHFPVKGLEGACRDSVTLQAGRHFPDDRIFAVGNGHARHEQSLGRASGTKRLSSCSRCNSNSSPN